MRNLDESEEEPLSSVDRMTVGAIRHRFMKVNDGRLARACAFLNAHQQAFLEALPLMLHVNHALLPGYVGNNTPAGVSHFEPDKRHIRATRSIANAFQYIPRTDVPSIHNISVMGSIGTVAHSRLSDLDFWICYSSDLSGDQVNELEEKLNGIQRFAEGLGLEVYFFLMNADQFRQGQRRGVSGEDCGSAQHYLLLDEFYRTGLLLAGRPPAWWLVPAHKEKQYDDYLKLLVSEQHVEANDFIDFGGIPVFPAGEFIGAGMWQLYKGIESPYKSVIKIMLTEVYASEYPSVDGLSLLFKSAIYQGEVDLDVLDPYVMLYRKIEAYLLKRKEPERLDLLRKCFYLKINEMMSRAPSRGAVTWKREVVARLIAEWQWSDAMIILLDSRRTWKVQQVIGQRKILVDELNFSYRFLSRFAKDNGFSALINSQDMSLLGRKLYAAFERKSGKIEYINPNIAPNLTEEHLSVRREFTTGQNGLKVGNWAVFSGTVQQAEQGRFQAIQRGPRVVELLAWCYFNGLIDGATRLTVAAGETDLTEPELRHVLNHLQSLYPERLEMASQDQFRQAARAQHITLFINVGVDPLSTMNRRGYRRITEHIDALNFSGLHDNLVVSIDQITKNTWNEITFTGFDRDQSVVDCVINYMRCGPPSPKYVKPKIDILCFGVTRPQSISQRVEALFDGIMNTFYSGKYLDSVRYVLSIANQFYIFQFRDHQPWVESASSASKLLRLLGAPQSVFSPIVFDAFFYSNDALLMPLPALAKNNRPDVVQVYYRCLGEKTLFYVFDERGSVVMFQETDIHGKAFLRQLNHFFKSIASHRRPGCPAYDVRFFEILRGTSGGIESRIVSDAPEDKRYYTVKVIIEKSADGEPYYIIFCDRKAFSEYQYGDGLFKAVATYIVSQHPVSQHQASQHPVSQRDMQQRYPVKISDLNFADPTTKQVDLQTSFYLRQKLAIEWQLAHLLKSIH
ncbi:MAG: class I adenylate cyclase [Gammaproteobacteria bacterium]